MRKIIIDVYGCKQTSPALGGSPNRAVNGANYLFGESVFLVNFIKVHTASVYVVCPPCSGWQRLSSHFSVLYLYSMSHI